jgi:hypothetical protein
MSSSDMTCPDKFVYAMTPAAELAAAVNRGLEVYGDAPPKPGALGSALAEAGEKAGLRPDARFFRAHGRPETSRFWRTRRLKPRR